MAKVALLVILLTAAVQFVVVLAIIHHMAPMPRRHDTAWTSHMFRGRPGLLLRIAVANGAVLAAGLIVFAVAA